jgi:hypothetical protein
MGELIPDVDSEAVLSWLGRRCPVCGAAGLIGHGRPWRTYQEQPAGGRQKRPRVQVAELLCMACQRTHRVLPRELGPQKRYRLEVLEEVCAAEGDAKARISAQLDGVSPERIRCSTGHWIGDQTTGGRMWVQIRAPRR